MKKKIIGIAVATMLIGGSMGAFAENQAINQGFFRRESQETRLEMKEDLLGKMLESGELTKAEYEDLMEALKTCTGEERQILRDKLGCGERLENGQGRHRGGRHHRNIGENGKGLLGINK